METGIYKILNLVNGKYYIGSTAEGFKIRKYNHFRLLKMNKHGNCYLQNAWNKHGEKNFEFIILEECLKEDCIVREQYWLDITKSYLPEIGYNICAKAGNTLGVKYTEEQKMNISNSLKGKMAGDKHPMWGKKRQPTTLGYKHTEESLEKMRIFQKNRIRSEEEKEKLRSSKVKGDNHWTRKSPLPEEEKERLRTLRKGVPNENKKIVLQFDLNMNLIGEYISISEAALVTGIPMISISVVCNREKNHKYKNKYIFMFKEAV